MHPVAGNEECPPAHPPEPPDFLTFLALTLTYESLDGPVTDLHPGSVWHGAWGKAVDTVACAVRQPNCHGCWMVSQCPAVALAAAKPGQHGPVAEASPPAFILRDLRGLDGGRGSLVEVDITLLAPATQHLPMLLLAAEHVGESGLGKERRRLRLVRTVESQGTSGPRVLREDRGPLQSLSVRSWRELEPLLLDGPVRLAFPRGAVLMSDRHPLTHPSLRDILRLLRRRVRLLCSERGLEEELTPECELLDWVRTVDILGASYEVHRASRWSARQRQRHPQDGVRGHLVVNGPDLVQIEPWLRLGQVLGVGKGTSFGLGRFEVTACR